MEHSQTQVETSGENLYGASNRIPAMPGNGVQPAGEQTSARRWNGNHFINVRLSIPLIFTRVYVALVVGKERRCKERRRAERAKHPLGTLGNAFFFSTTSALISLAAVAVMIVATVLVIRELFSIEIIVR